MALPDPRRLAAADMYGTRGTPRRRWIVRAEFIASAIGCTAVGVSMLVGQSGGWIVLGAWLVGVGANYIPLAAEAHRLSRPAVLDAEMAGREPRSEMRRATRAQLWIAAPFAICLAAFSQRAHSP